MSPVQAVLTMTRSTIVDIIKHNGLKGINVYMCLEMYIRKFYIDVYVHANSIFMIVNMFPFIPSPTPLLQVAPSSPLSFSLPICSYKEKHEKLSFPFSLSL
jgi:hypothetical protein